MTADLFGAPALPVSAVLPGGSDAAAGSDAERLCAPLADAFAAVPSAWRSVTDSFADSATGRALCTFVDARVAAGAAVYPPRVFRALELTAPEAVRIVVLGQDPYHGAGQAQGLAFSVNAGQRLPPSLRNILQEVARDTGRPSACTDGDLSRWAAQGVLLLNTVLTVEQGLPQSHADRGWEALTDGLIAHVAAHAQALVFLLWGASAQRKRGLISSGRHAVLTANHPSPLAARRPPEPFVGCRHFSRANDFLINQANALSAIAW